MKLSRCSVLDIYLGVPKKITEGGGRSHTGWNVPQYLKAQTVWWCNNRLEKYEFVNGVGIIPYMKWKICLKPPTRICFSEHVISSYVRHECTRFTWFDLMFSPQSHQQFHLTWWCRILQFFPRWSAMSCLQTLRSFTGKKKELTSAWIQRFLKKISPLHHWLVISIHLKSINCNHLSICWDQTIILGSWGLNYSPNIPIPLSFLFI